MIGLMMVMNVSNRCDWLKLNKKILSSGSGIRDIWKDLNGQISTTMISISRGTTKTRTIVHTKMPYKVEWRVGRYLLSKVGLNSNNSLN